MFGDLKEYWGAQQNGDQIQNGPQEDPDNGGLIVKDNLRMIGVKQVEEVSRDKKKWKEVVVVAAMDLNGL